MTAGEEVGVFALGDSVAVGAVDGAVDDVVDGAVDDVVDGAVEGLSFELRQRGSGRGVGGVFGEC